MSGTSPHLLEKDEDLSLTSEFISDRWLSSRDTGLGQFLTNFSKVLELVSGRRKSPPLLDKGGKGLLIMGEIVLCGA